MCLTLKHSNGMLVKLSAFLSVDVITSLFPSSQVYHVEFFRNQSGLSYIEGEIGERGK